jgi:hypothetical protein
VCEIAQRKLSRNGDIGADKPGVLEPKGDVLQTAEVALNGETAYLMAIGTDRRGCMVVLAGACHWRVGEPVTWEMFLVGRIER